MGSTVKMKAFLLVLVTAAFAQDSGQVDEGDAFFHFNCPMYDIDLHGYDVDVFQDIGSWQECAHICNIYPSNCKFWSWNGGNGNRYCYMKSSNAGMQSWEGSVSGERGCSG